MNETSDRTHRFASLAPLQDALASQLLLDVDFKPCALGAAQFRLTCDAEGRARVRATFIDHPDAASPIATFDEEEDFEFEEEDEDEDDDLDEEEDEDEDEDDEDEDDEDDEFDDEDEEDEDDEFDEDDDADDEEEDEEFAEEEIDED